MTISYSHAIYKGENATKIWREDFSRQNQEGKDVSSSSLDHVGACLPGGHCWHWGVKQRLALGSGMGLINYQAKETEMSPTATTNIGFIGSSAPSSPHHDSFKSFIPKDIDFTFVQEEGAGASLYDARGKVDSLLHQIAELVEKHAWDGVIISGGPREVLNPGLRDRLSSALKIPVATALSSSVAALKVFSADAGSIDDPGR